MTVLRFGVAAAVAVRISTMAVVLEEVVVSSGGGGVSKRGTKGSTRRELSARGARHIGLW